MCSGALLPIPQHVQKPDMCKSYPTISEATLCRIYVALNKGMQHNTHTHTYTQCCQTSHSTYTPNNTCAQPVQTCEPYSPIQLYPTLKAKAVKGNATHTQCKCETDATTATTAIESIDNNECIMLPTATNCHHCYHCN